MLHDARFTALLVLLIGAAALSGCTHRTQGPPAVAPPSITTAPVVSVSPPATVRAMPGDTVYMVEHFVRAAKRDQFESFLTTVYWPALGRAAEQDSVARKVLHQTRILFPSRANADGTFTYVFVMDPVVRGESYSILELLRRVHSAEEATQLYGQLTASWARPFVARPLVQPAIGAPER